MPQHSFLNAKTIMDFKQSVRLIQPTIVDMTLLIMFVKNKYLNVPMILTVICVTVLDQLVKLSVDAPINKILINVQKPQSSLTVMNMVTTLGNVLKLIQVLAIITGLMILVGIQYLHIIPIVLV